MSNEVVSRPGTPPMSFDDLFTNPTGTPARKSTTEKDTDNTEKDTDNKRKTKPPSFDNWMKTASAHATFPKGGKKTRKRSRSKKGKKSKHQAKKKTSKRSHGKKKRSRKRVTRRRARMRGGFLSGWFKSSNATETPPKKELTKEEKDRIMAEMNAEHEAELEDYGMRG